MKYKVGDKVVLRDDLEGDQGWNGIYLTPEIERLKGLVLEIDEIHPSIPNKFYSVEAKKEWWNINDSMIDHDKTADLKGVAETELFKKQMEEECEKTAELKKDKTLNHYSGELEKVVAEKNKIHQGSTAETKFMTDKIDRHKELTDYMHKTYIRKNKDYGDSFSRVHREIGWQSSLGDIAHKFYRLQNLMQNKGEHQVEDETTIDTLIDLANYSLLLAMELEDE